ncbi:hypothetical protein DFH09DRAFT_1164219 [Mycena vulgaris]|nr:hypothetical protein DFH09DRAFT_1164219 [Mycena vulgaris]
MTSCTVRMVRCVLRFAFCVLLPSCTRVPLHPTRSFEGLELCSSRSLLADRCARARGCSGPGQRWRMVPRVSGVGGDAWSWTPALGRSVRVQLESGGDGGIVRFLRRGCGRACAECGM